MSATTTPHEPELVATLGEVSFRSGRRIEIVLLSFGRNDRSVRLVEHNANGTKHSQTWPCARLPELRAALERVNAEWQLVELAKPEATAPSPVYSRGPRFGRVAP